MSDPVDLSQRRAAEANERDAFRRAAMVRIRVNASQLLAAMKTVADSDVEFTKVYGTVVKDELAFEQLMIDLQSLAGLARMEE